MTQHSMGCYVLSPIVFAYALRVLAASTCLEHTSALQPLKRTFGPRHQAVNSRLPFDVSSMGTQPASPHLLKTHRQNDRHGDRLCAKPDDHVEGPVEAREDIIGRDDDDDDDIPQQPSNTGSVTTRAEDLPWFDVSYIRESLNENEDSDSVTKSLPLFTSSLIFVASIVGTIYLYYVGLTM